MSLKTFKIEILAQKDADRLLAFYEAAGFAYRSHDRPRLVESVAAGLWTGFVASDGGRDIGGFYLNWEPKYGLYRRLDLPEVQDLRVLESDRKRGVATALLEAALDNAKQAGKPGLGISVGLNANFGQAQKLYIKMGFVPDGQGVTYDRMPVAPGERRPVDDDLALMLLKLF